jgi:hypothetical protein
VLRDLPRLFQLAIRAARMLRLRHLWIEKLCVLQDSKADVATEQLDNGRVYNNGRITITASSEPHMYEVLKGSPWPAPCNASTFTLVHDRVLGSASKAYSAFPADVWTKELLSSTAASNSSYPLRIYRFGAACGA